MQKVSEYLKIKHAELYYLVHNLQNKSIDVKQA